jgi:LysM repeat protein
VAVNTKDSVKWNDTLSGIASHYGMTWQQLFSFNTSTGSKGANRPASTIATLKKRGPNLVYNGTTFYVPKKGTVYSGGY